MSIVIAENDSWIQYIATGGETGFDYDFPIFDGNELVVDRTRAEVVTTLTLTTHYTVGGVGAEDGGMITLAGTAAPAMAGDIYTLYRSVPIKRTSNYTTAGDFRAAAVNREFQQLFMIAQEVRRDVGRAVTLLPSDDSPTPFQLPSKSSRSLKYLAFDGDGVPVASSGTTSTPISAAMEAIVAAATVAEARASLGLATVSQAEAEAGTATTERAWTAERVAQAIAAWVTAVGNFLEADVDAVLAAGFGQGYQALGSLDAMAGDTLAITEIVGSNRKTLTVDVDGTIDVSAMAAGAILIRATNTGTRSLTFTGATLTGGSAAFSGVAGKVNLLLFESDGATVDLTIDQRGT